MEESGVCSGELAPVGGAEDRSSGEGSPLRRRSRSRADMRWDGGSLAVCNIVTTLATLVWITLRHLFVHTMCYEKLQTGSDTKNTTFQVPSIMLPHEISIGQLVDLDCQTGIREEVLTWAVVWFG